MLTAHEQAMVRLGFTDQSSLKNFLTIARGIANSEDLATPEGAAAILIASQCAKLNLIGLAPRIAELEANALVLEGESLLDGIPSTVWLTLEQARKHILNEYLPIGTLHQMLAFHLDGLMRGRRMLAATPVLNEMSTIIEPIGIGAVVAGRATPPFWSTTFRLSYRFGFLETGADRQPQSSFTTFAEIEALARHMMFVQELGSEAAVLH